MRTDRIVGLPPPLEQHLGFHGVVQRLRGPPGTGMFGSLVTATVGTVALLAAPRAITQSRIE